MDCDPDPGRRRFLRAGLAAGAVLAGCAGRGGSGATPSTSTDAGGYAVETVATGLSSPWGLTVLPDGTVLVTERPGSMVHVDPGGGTRSVGGLPEVYAAGQGGLLDVTVHPDFADEPWVYLTYAGADGEGGSTTHVGRGRFDPDTPRLEGFEELHAAEPFVASDAHFGSRAVFGPGGRLYVTVGDRQFKNFGPEHVAQDRTNDLGSVLRFEPDGSVPADNPFVGEPGVRDTVFSYGHRNPQGLAVHPDTGALWEHEHGEQDGDEINVLEAGGNFGWPVATEACTYGGGDPIGVSHADRPDVVDPVHYWPCGSGGFPPSGLAIYDGPVEAWQGDLFAGTLAGTYLGRFSVEGRGDVEVRERERLLADRDWRIRAVTVGPSGGLLVAVDADPAPLVRIAPA